MYYDTIVTIWKTRKAIEQLLYPWISHNSIRTYVVFFAGASHVEANAVQLKMVGPQLYRIKAQYPCSKRTIALRVLANCQPLSV